MKKNIVVILFYTVFQLHACEGDNQIFSMQVQIPSASDIQRTLQETVGKDFCAVLHNRHMLREDPSICGRIPSTYINGRSYFAFDLAHKKLPLCDVIRLTDQHLNAYVRAIYNGAPPIKFRSALLFSLLKDNPIALQELQRHGQYSQRHVDELKKDAYKY